MIYAGFWVRLGAWMVDQAIVIVAMVPLVMLLALQLDIEGRGQADLDSRANGLALLVSWLYYAVMESSSRQATFGKRLLRLQVTDEAGDPISFARASGRFFGKIASGLTLGIGILMIAVTPRKRGLHDVMAGCLVARRVKPPSDPAG